MKKRLLQIIKPQLTRKHCLAKKRLLYVEFCDQFLFFNADKYRGFTVFEILLTFVQLLDLTRGHQDTRDRQIQ